MFDSLAKPKREADKTGGDPCVEVTVRAWKCRFMLSPHLR